MTESPVSNVVTDTPSVDAVRDGGASTGAGDRSHEDAARALVTADQPLVCPSCQGVIVGVQAAAYTPARGRLIVTNGYCQGDCSGQ
ncbi:hypothetical protein ACTMTI_55530 [Nonomuraea sp. H19]|uniref:hypothetical protein n=1 Tax=Nonomuraea sp. H19 TaxID=3452206 RepID=UPI003F889D8A